MLEHAGEVTIREIFEFRIAESSQKTLKLRKNSSLEIAKVGANTIKQKYSPDEQMLV